jgi:hypothetical protein
LKRLKIPQNLRSRISSLSSVCFADECGARTTPAWSPPLFFSQCFGKEGVGIENVLPSSSFLDNNASPYWREGKILIKTSFQFVEAEMQQ